MVELEQRHRSETAWAHPSGRKVELISWEGVVRDSVRQITLVALKATSNWCPQPLPLPSLTDLGSSGVHRPVCTASVS